MTTLSFKHTKEWEWLISVIGLRLVELSETRPETLREPHHLQFQMAKNDIDWAGLRCLYAVACFSYLDARPRAIRTEQTFAAHLDLGLFFDRLDYMPSGELLWRGDEINHKRVATYLRLKSSGELFVTTYQRGLAARHWLHQIKGNKLLSVV